MARDATDLVKAAELGYAFFLLIPTSKEHNQPNMRAKHSHNSMTGRTGRALAR
jgi:hypothetical protein